MLGADGDWHSMDEIRAALGDMTEPARKRLARRLDQMTEAGLVERTGSGRGTKYRQAN